MAILTVMLAAVGARPATAAGGTDAQAPQANSAVLAAAGDTACAPADRNFNGAAGTGGACHMRAVADAMLAARPDLVLPLGDTQYECGEAAGFQASFGPTWGRPELKSLLRPVIGNHEYGSSCHRNDPSGYFDYFGPAAGDPAKGYYSYDIAGWHVLALNSQCQHIGGCGTGSPQEVWVARELAAHPGTCTLAYWHEPRFSSGEHGDAQQMAVIWNDLVGHASIVLSGHNHDYERFDPIGLTPPGPADKDSTTTGTPSYQDPVSDPEGIREFVVGTGGKNLYPFRPSNGPGPTAPLHAEAVRDSTTFGFLKLTLAAESYQWAFTPDGVKGTFVDHGAGTCLGASDPEAATVAAEAARLNRTMRTSSTALGANSGSSKGTRPKTGPGMSTPVLVALSSLIGVILVVLGANQLRKRRRRAPDTPSPDEVRP